MYYIQYSYNKVSYRKENVKNHKAKECAYSTVLYLSKKVWHKWTHTVQTHVVQCQLYMPFFLWVAKEIKGKFIEIMAIT